MDVLIELRLTQNPLAPDHAQRTANQGLSASSQKIRLLAARHRRKPLFPVLADPEIRGEVGVGVPFALRNAVYDQRATHDGFWGVLRLGLGAGLRM